MPKGPLGAPRPFSEYRLIVDPQEREVTLVKVGPLGGPRPFAKNNPPITDEEITECMLSDTGQAFGAGFVTNGRAETLDELSAEQAKEALEITEEYCTGVLEGMALEDEERGDAFGRLEDITNALENNLPDGESVELEVLEL